MNDSDGGKNQQLDKDQPLLEEWEAVIVVSVLQAAGL